MTFQHTEKGARLRKIIEYLDLTQKEFGLKVGLSQCYLAQVISGNKDLSGTLLEGIALAFGNKYNIVWLLTGTGKMLVVEPGEDQGVQTVEEEKPQYQAEPGKILLSDLPEMFREMVDDVKQIRKLLENQLVNQ